MINRGIGGAGGVGYKIGTIPLEVIPLVSYGANIGKGLEENCSPYRTAYVFGAELNLPDANNWNCFPDIMDATTVFDLSQITPNHEVVVAILYISNLYNGLTVYHKWYLNSGNKLLYSNSYNIPDPESYGYDYWLWYYVYSYIGYVPWEIWENGAYHVNLITNNYSQSLNFNVVGIEEEINPLPVIISLQPGEERIVSFEFIPRNIKVYSVQVDGLSGNFVSV